MSHLFIPVAFIAGFAAAWLSKDKLTQFATGTDEFVRKLEAKLAALKAAL